MVDWTVSLAQGAGLLDGRCDEAFGLFHGAGQRFSLGQKGGDGRGIGTTGTMGVAGEYPLGRKNTALIAVKEDIGGVLPGEVSPFDEDIGRTLRVKGPGSLLHLRLL